MKPRLLTAAVATLILSGAAAQAAQLLNDGSFEGALNANWTKSGPGNVIKTSGAVDNISGAYAGSYFARFNTPNGAANNNAIESLSQTFSDVLGKTYKVTAYVSTTAPANNRTSFWAIDINGTQYAGNNPSVTEGWTQETFTFTGTGSDTISLIADNSKSSIFTEYDSVTVKGPAPGIPEPSTWALVIIGVGLTGAALRRRRQVVA